MKTDGFLRENLRFLVIEVEAQVLQTRNLLRDYDVDRFESIAAKDDYIDNQKTTIENECFSRIHGQAAMAPSEVDRIRSIHVMCVNLERIADFCVNIARQTDYLSQYSFLDRFPLDRYFSIIQAALADITTVFGKQDMAGALRICRSEHELDRLYEDDFREILTELKTSPHVQNLITVIFILRYLERIGDALLNIGEAILFSITGDRIKIRQFAALEKTLKASGFQGSVTDVDWNSFWGSRSGCRISRIEGKNGIALENQGIFKEGALKKIKKEKENILKWEKLRPGLGPTVYGYEENASKASLLVEFLPGQTLQEIILTGGPEERENALANLEQLLTTVWTAGMKPGACSTDYMSQLKARKNAVLKVHPDFWRHPKSVGDLVMASSDDLIKSCSRAEKDLPAPFSVFIHGDFNVNNILVEPADATIHFIDLYRSKIADYVQDASVFILSNFRIPTRDWHIRERLNEVINRFWTFFSNFAEKEADHTFQARMALALARSFYTSTRFEMNAAFAKVMYLRAMFLLEKIDDHRGRPWEAFTLPTESLYY